MRIGSVSIEGAGVSIGGVEDGIAIGEAGDSIEGAGNSIERPGRDGGSPEREVTESRTCLRGRQAADRFLDTYIEIQIIPVRFST